METFYKIKNHRGAASLATILIISLLVFGGGFYYLAQQPIKAASLTSVKDTLSTSAPATAANHTIQFVTQTAVDQSDTIVINLDTIGTLDQFTIGSLTAADFDLAIGASGNCSSPTDAWLSNAFGEAAFPSSTFTVTVASSTDTITFTATSTAAIHIATSSCVVIEIGTNAAFQTTGSNQITNPAKVATEGTADIHDIAISFTGSAAADSGSALVAIVEGVTVSVTVDESMSFSISGVASSSCTFGGTATVMETTSSTVRFPSSSLSTNTFYKGCQTLTISTNASSGYAITGQQNTSLLSSGGATIDDTTCDGGACTEVVASATTNTWATATNNGFGYTCNGSPCNSAFNDGGAALGFSQFACTGSDAQCDVSTGSETAYAFASSSAPVSNATSTIVYKLSVSGSQEAGEYSNTITYIATPTF